MLSSPDPEIALPASTPPGRLKSILGVSAGNLVEWFDWYVYSAFSLYFAKAFFPHGDQTAQFLATSGIFWVGFLMRPLGGWLLGRIGDRHGRSAASWVRGALAEQARVAGIPHAANAPYAGGETLARHGRPEANIHAVQLEVDRALYLAPDLRTPGIGLNDTAALVARMVAALAAAALVAIQPLAAE